MLSKDISYDFIADYIIQNELEKCNDFRDNCFKHVLAAFHYIKTCHPTQHLPTQFEGGSGFVLKSYTQVHVKDIMKVEQREKS